MKLSLIQPKLGSKLITLMALTFVLLMIGASGLAIEVPDLDRIQSGLIDGHSVTLAGALPVPTASFDFALNVPASSELVHVDSGSANADSLQPLSDENSNKPGAENFNAEMTWYNTGLGSCGRWNNENDHICAISQILYNCTNIDGNPNHNPICGRKILLKRGGRSIEVAVMDNCPECPELNIDVTKSVFQALGDLREGRVRIEWRWI